MEILKLLISFLSLEKVIFEVTVLEGLSLRLHKPAAISVIHRMLEDQNIVFLVLQCLKYTFLSDKTASVGF